MKRVIDLDRYKSDEVIQITPLPFNITAKDRIVFSNMDSLSMLVFFLSPNSCVIGPCQSGCYLPRHETGITWLSMGSKNSSIVTVSLGEKSISFTETPLTKVYSFEHNPSEVISFQYQITISFRIRSNKITSFIEYVVSNCETSVNKFVERAVLKVTRSIIVNHINTIINNGFVKDSSELSKLIYDICNEQNNLINAINRSFEDYFTFITARVEYLSISCTHRPIEDSDEDDPPKPQINWRVEMISVINELKKSHIQMIKLKSFLCHFGVAV